MLGFLAFSALCLTQVRGAPQADEVFALPGWNKKLFSRTYAGYIEVGSKAPDATKMYEHYLYFESEGDPATDPLIMWTNGGPGASSFFGSFSELGPYALSDASLKTDDYKKTGVPSLFENPFRWSKLGNLLIRNLPPPIGFSYCDPAGPSGDGYSCGPWNDTSVAEHSYDFLDGFVKAFPELQKNDLFLTGESYAGVYVPMMAQQITDVHPDGVLAKMLKGIAIGDGCTTGDGCIPNTGPLLSVEFYHGHGQFSTKTYNRIQAVCTKDELRDGTRGDVSKICYKALDQMDKEKGYNFGYNLYDECYDFSLDDGLSAAPRWHEAPKIGGPAVHGLEARRKKKALLRQQEEDKQEEDKQDSTVNKPSLTSSIDDPNSWHMDGSPCGGTDVLPDWAGHPLVKKALHVAPDAKFFTGDNGVGFSYKGTERGILDYYKEIVQRNRDNPGKAMRILIYNGDSDPGLNSFVGEQWTTNMGFNETETWRPWTRDGKSKMGGYVTRYNGSFDYLTIRGSGHMVPEFKPEAASVFLDSFLKDVPYPFLHMPGN